MKSCNAANQPKRVLNMSCALLLAQMLGAATPVVTDRTLYITEPGAVSQLSGDMLDMLNDNTITNVSIATDAFTNDTALVGYCGSWTIDTGYVWVSATTNAFGIHNDADEDAGAIWVNARNTSYATGSIRFQSFPNALCPEYAVDKPIFVTHAGSTEYKVLRCDAINNSTTSARIHYQRRVVIDGSCNFHFQGGGARMYFEGGLTNETGTISDTGANGRMVIVNVPCHVRSFNMNWLYLDFEVAHNHVEEINSAGTGKITFGADNALDLYPTLLNNFNSSSAGISLNGHDVTVGGIKNFKSNCPLAAISGTPTFTFTNATDLTSDTFPTLSGAVTLSKGGPGKITFTNYVGSTGKLIVREGTVELADTATWSACNGIVLSGGSLVCTSATNLPTSVSFDITDPNANGVLSVADNVSLLIASFRWGETDYLYGVLGGAAATRASQHLDCFSSTQTGIVQLESKLTISVAKGETVNLSDWFGAHPAELAALNRGDVSHIIKTGAGILNLDYNLAAFSGIFLIDQGWCIVLTDQNPLGVAGLSGLDYIDINNENEARLYLGTWGSASPWKTLAIDKPIHINNANHVGVLCCDGTTTTFLKPFTADKGANMLFRGSWTLRGGATVNGSIWMNCACSPTINVLDTPITVTETFSLYYMTLRLGVAGNKIGALSITSGSYFHLDADDALPYGVNSLLFKCNDKTTAGTFYLHGHNFKVAYMAYEKDTTSQGFKIANGVDDTPAVIAITNQTVAITNVGYDITGPVSLEKAGKSAYGFNRPVSAVGNLTVKGGRLDLCENACWPGATNITVSGETAVLGLAAATNVFNRATVSLEAGGKCDLTEGVRHHVGDLYLDGKPVQKSGSYGSSLSDARYKNDTYFTGKGVLLVHSTVEGTMILFR